MVSDTRAAGALDRGAEAAPPASAANPRLAASASDWRIAALIFGCSLLFLVISMGRGVQVYDEALVLVGATRVADGAIPHRDFYTPYGPAQFYVLAGLFKVFGQSVLVERAWDSIVRAGIVTVAFLVVRRAASRRDAWIAAAVILLWVRAVENYAYPVFPSLLFSLIAVLCVSPIFASRGSRSLMFAAGVSVGITVLFRYDAGAYAFVAVTLVLAAYSLSQRLPLRKRIDELIEVLAPCWLGVAVVCVPVAVAFAANDVLRDFYFDIIYFPTHTYARVRALPFPGILETLTTPSKMGVYLPVAVWIGALIAVAIGRRATRASDTGDSRPWIMLLLGVLSALFYLQGVVRAERVHMTLSIVPALMLASALLPYTKLRLAGRFTLAGVVVAGVWLIFVGDPTLFAIGKNGLAIVNNVEDAAKGLPLCRRTQGLERTTCFGVGPQFLVDAIRYVEANNGPDEPIFVGLKRHDRLKGNNILFYFQTARRPATKWYQYDPGLQTTEAVQTEMIRELRSARPRYVVLFPVDDFSESNDSATSSGVALLDDFIRANYKEEREFGFVSVLRVTDDHLSQ